jgi:Ser/Thr protein kinase RdoA (MazF antagonist)
MGERQVSQTEEQRKRRRGSTLKREDTKLKKEKRKHMSETAERWRETMPKQTIKEAIHLDVILFKSVVPYVEVRQRRSQLK